jgi:biopolymer transport protein ExbB
MKDAKMRKLSGIAAVALLAAVASAPMLSVAALAQTATTDPAPAQTAPAPAPAPDASAPPPATAAAPDAAPAAAPAEPATEDAENPYGLGALWKNGDFVARGTLSILVIMSIATWYIMITKYFQQARLFAAGRQANKQFWTAPSVAEGANKLSKKSVFGYIARSGVSAADHHEGTLTEQVDRASWVSLTLDRAVTRVNSRMQGGLAVLATVGSTAPFVGLFGTVWGIYHALTAIGIAGQASIDKVAGPVGEALIMTAIGLATAVPAVLGYNFLVRRNKAVMERVRDFNADLYAVLLSGRRVGVGAPTSTMTTMPIQRAAE